MNSQPETRGVPRPLVAVVLVALVLGFLWQASIFWSVTIDDAYISFRYSLNLLEGHGLRYNVGDDPVEGFTNFTWILLMAAALALRADVMFAAKVAGLLSSVLLMYSTWIFARRLRGRDDAWNLLAPAFIAFNTCTARWALMGLETQLAVLLVFVTYVRFVVEIDEPGARLLSPWLAVLAAMTRFDSIFYLLPLALYGGGLVLFGRAAFRRLLVWASIASVGFGSFFIWKVWYFGDVLPNTYYAKHRLVQDQGNRKRAVSQLRSFYLEHGVIEERAIANGEAETDAGDRTGTAKVLSWARGGLGGPLWWTAWWVVGALALFVVPPPRTLLLVLLPLLLNAYYVYYNNGDWMPNFRFFQIAVPFLALLGPLAIPGNRYTRLRWPMGVSFGAVGLFLAIGQLQFGAVPLVGRKAWLPRPAGWTSPSLARKSYRKGFSGALHKKSEWLLLNTQDGASIYMGDIGLPMWLASHLSCLPHEGLTDKHLGHAPSVRGDLRSLDQQVELARAAFDARDPERKERHRERRVLKLASDAYWAQHQERNVRYVLEERRPEYLLLFLMYDQPGGEGAFRPYPPLSRAIYDSPQREQDYEFAWRTPKTARAWASVFRRTDVPESVPDPSKLERLRRAMERNPRDYRLVMLAYDALQEMQDSAAREATRGLVTEGIERLARDPDSVQAFLPRIRHQRDDAMEEALLDAALRRSGDDPFVLRTVAREQWLAGAREEALATLEKAVDRAPRRDVSAHRDLAVYYQQLERWEDSLVLLREATERLPEDAHGWRRLAYGARTAARRRGVEPKTARALRDQALAAFERAHALDGRPVPNL